MITLIIVLAILMLIVALSSGGYGYYYAPAYGAPAPGWVSPVAALALAFFVALVLILAFGWPIRIVDQPSAPSGPNIEINPPEKIEIPDSLDIDIDNGAKETNEGTFPSPDRGDEAG